MTMKRNVSKSFQGKKVFVAILFIGALCAVLYFTIRTAASRNVDAMAEPLQITLSSASSTEDLVTVKIPNKQAHLWYFVYDSTRFNYKRASLFREKRPNGWGGQELLSAAVSTLSIAEEKEFWLPSANETDMYQDFNAPDDAYLVFETSQASSFLDAFRLYFLPDGDGRGVVGHTTLPPTMERGEPPLGYVYRWSWSAGAKGH